MKRNIIALALSVSAALPGASFANDTVDYKSGVSLGYGYDAFTGSFTRPCFQGEIDPTFFATPHGNFVWEESENLEALRRNLNVSVSAAYDGLASNAEGKVSYLRSFRSSLSTVTLVARSRIETGFDSILNPELSADIARQVESNGTVDRLKLREICGTHYVQSIVTGGELFATLTQEIGSQTEKDEFSAVLSASGSGFSSSANEKSALEESRFSKTVNISGNFAGVGKPNPTSAAELKQQFIALRTDISSIASDDYETRQRRAAPISIVLVKIAAGGEDAEKLAALEVALHKETALRNYRADLFDVVRNPSLFNLDPKDLSLKAEEIDEQINTAIRGMRRKMYKCSQSHGDAINDDCNFSPFPTAPASVDSGLPKLFQQRCSEDWTPPNFTQQFAVLPKTRGDASMGGGDTVMIDTDFSGSKEQPLQQSTTVRIYEATNQTRFQRTHARSFFDPNAAPRAGCYLTAPVDLKQIPGEFRFGDGHNDYRNIEFNTDLVTNATCRSNKSGGDVGYVGCNKISFKPLRLPLDHIERLVGPVPVKLQTPDWLQTLATTASEVADASP